MVTITNSAIEKMREEMNDYLKEGKEYFIRLSMGAG